MTSVDASLLRGTIRLTPGRIEWCAREIRRQLRADEKPALEQVTTHAEESGRRAFRIFETRRTKRRRGAYGKLARQANTEMDDASIAVHGLLDALARAYPHGTAEGDRVRRLREAFFPLGLRHATNSGFIEETAAVRSMLAFADGDGAADVAVVPGLRDLLARLAGRVERLEAVLTPDEPKRPSYDDFTAAAAEADLRMCDLVNAIQSLYRGSSPGAVARRDELLAPFVFQQENLRERYRRRLPNVEIDPTTGEDLTEAEADAGDEGDGGEADEGHEGGGSPGAPGGSASTRAPA